MSTGDIGAVLDTLEFDLVHCDHPSICHIAGEVYACAWEGDSIDGFLCTFKVDSLGAIPAAVEDSWEFDASEGEQCCILRVGTAYVVIAYQTSAAAGKIATIGVNAAGDITEALQDTLTAGFEGVCVFPNIIHVTGDVYAIAYGGTGTGYIKTFTVSTTGAISAGFTDSLTFALAADSGAKLCHVDGNIYCVTCQSDDTFGYIKTFSISSVGAISDAFISTYKFYDAIGGFNAVVKARPNYFAVAFQGESADGWMKIIHINNAGAITDPAVDIYEYDIQRGAYQSMVALGDGYIALSYSGYESDGFLKTFLVDASGDLNDTTLGTLEFDPVHCVTSSLFHVTANIFGIAYTCEDNDGMICSTSIEMPTERYPQHLMMMGVG